MKSFIFKTVAAFSCVCNVSIVHAQSSAAFVNTASSTQSVKKIQKPTPSMGSFAQVRVVQGASPTFKRNGLPLYAKKKKKDTTVGKSGKIQVKLLKYVAGTGSAGEVIMVAPAFFANKLQKTGSAVRISDDDVEKESEVQKQKDDEATSLANDLKEKLDGKTLTLAKKAGPDGQLFGGIGYKLILSELKKDFPKGCLDAKYIKMTSIKDDGDDGKVLKHDIKTIGEYTATISLLKGVSADFQVVVTSE